MVSDLWKYAANRIKSDINKSKLDKYHSNQLKKNIKNKLLTLGTKVYVISNEVTLRKCILETPGLNNINEKIPYLRKVGIVIDVDKDVGHSKISFRNNKKIWFPITTLKLYKPIKLENIKNIQSDNLDTAKSDSRKKNIKSMYQCVQELQQQKEISNKQRVNMQVYLIEKSRMNLREACLMHQKKNYKLKELSSNFDRQLKKIKKNRCFDQIKLPKI